MDDEQPNVPPQPEPQEVCTICQEALGAITFADDPQNGTLTLPCHPTHSFHGACLQNMVYLRSFNPNHDGQVFEGVNFWSVLPPVCPLCRARFSAGNYWPAYAAADAYPDEGNQYQELVAVDDDDLDEDVDLDDAIMGNGEPDEESTDSEDDAPFDADVGNEEFDEEYSSSDDDMPYVANIGCSRCNIGEGPHDEMTADDLIDTYGPDTCFICNVAIAYGDEQPVLRCRNCGAVSHYHD